jgi:8-amino-7-oxononanoate synthase
MISNAIQQKIERFTLAGDLEKAGIYPYFRSLERNDGTTVQIGGKEVLMFGSNSYMGLANHPRVMEAAELAVRRYGTSFSGSRFLNGTSDLHLRLEEELAAFTGKEAALVFSTGYQTNLGVVATLTGRNDVILLDEMDHASIIEGSRLSFSRVLKYAHNDMTALGHLLKGLDRSLPKLLVTDGVFSMEGDIADLPAIAALADQYDAMIMVDDAHALGILGPNGEGTAAHFGLTDRVDLIMGTFSKSLASLGGFIAGDSKVIHYLKHFSRALIFSASIPPASAAAALAALDIIRREPDRIRALWSNTRYMASCLLSLGYDLGKSETPILPVFIRNDMDTFRYTSELMRKGMFVNPVVSPAVPADASLIRVSLMATHTREQIDRAVELIRQTVPASRKSAPQEVMSYGAAY